MELRVAADVQKALASSPGPESEILILKLRQDLRVYQTRALRAYKENVEQLSLMLLTLMEIWMAIGSLIAQRLLVSRMAS